MAIFEILQEAIEKHRCVAMWAEGRWREVAPLAIGFKDGKQKVLTFQYKGDSKSGLAEGGAWRCFNVDSIAWARHTKDPWQSGNYPIAKTESTFDTVICGLGARTRTFEHKRQR